MTNAFPLLLERYAIRGVELRNRVVFLPHVTFYAERQRPSARHRHYYEERARGGVGLIVTESQVVHPTGGHGKCVDAGDRDGMRAWGETIRAVHAQGARIFAQLTHHGVEAFSADTLLPQWAPSAIANPAVREIPKAMTHGDIREARGSYRLAAEHALEAGFDGVELKVGHDGLLRAFLSPFYNRRDDDYGHGSPENRLRFVLETLAAVRGAVGDLPLGIRICLDERMPGGYGLDEGVALAAAIAESAAIDYLSADMGTWLSVEAQVPPASIPEGYADAATAAARRATGLPTVAFGRIISPGHAENLLATGSADLIGMARQLLADPDWVRKVEAGDADDIRPCIHCNQECVGRLVRELPISCVHNPAAGREERLGRLTLLRATSPRRVVVVGGGPAGMKAAEIAAARGHETILIEREPALGGQVALAGSVPGHDEWGEIVVHLQGRLGRLGVEVRLGAEATPEKILAERPDAVVVATGSRPGPWPFRAGSGVRVMNEWEALRSARAAEGHVLVLDLGVRLEGATVAEALALGGARVTWVAPTPVVGMEIDPGTAAVLFPHLAALGVVRRAETTVLEADHGGVQLLNVIEKTMSRLDDVDAIVVVGNKVAADELANELTGAVEVHAIGDCVAPRHVAIAIYEGELVGRSIGT